MQHHHQHHTTAGDHYFAGPSIYSGDVILPAHAAHPLLDSPTKTRGAQRVRVLPLTVKQITTTYRSGDGGKSGLIPDSLDATNVRLVGMVMNKIERPTDTIFTLNDGTGCVDVALWVTETSEAEEVAAIENGMYVVCHLKGFQAKGTAYAVNVRLVTDFNDISLHFLECIYAHLENYKRKVHGFSSDTHTNLTMDTPFSFEVKGYQVPLSNEFVAHSVMDAPGNNIYKLVLEVFLEPAILARENGLHVNEVVGRLGIPKNKIMEAISYHVDVGNIYSTIDEYHFKSACNG